MRAGVVGAVGLIGPETVFLVVVGIGRDGNFRDRMGLQVVEDHLDSRFQLAVVPLGDVLGQVLDWNVGSDAVVFDLPFAVDALDGVARSHDVAAIEEAGIAADADQAAPGAGTDQLANAGLAEVPGHGVATGA